MKLKMRMIFVLVVLLFGCSMSEQKIDTDNAAMAEMRAPMVKNTSKVLISTKLNSLPSGSSSFLVRVSELLLASTKDTEGIHDDEIPILVDQAIRVAGMSSSNSIAAEALKEVMSVVVEYVDVKSQEWGLSLQERNRASLVFFRAALTGVLESVREKYEKTKT